ncbi:WXG100 family type VII secretion target [Paractinoplanes globisporus]|uniref:WXG100 family type VII secretion target n=1 Tax=Paractinoplanes globisporus TaxID=113565 RepID=A0ABW6WQV7_9ACTN|nr:hypothetical protein [Actinoplanes globisporus]
MAELGETDDPRALVPGDATAIVATAQQLRARGDALHEAGTGLRRIDTGDGWSGRAADAFRARFQGQPGRWLEAGDCFHSAADALTSYSGTLTWAQREAARAIAQWNAGQDAAARDTLDNARHQLDGAGDAAAGTVGSARDRAPEKPGFWSKVGDFFEDVGAGLANAGGHVVNGLASFGNAMIHHPGGTTLMAAGTGLMVLGAAGEVGGGLLDLTVVGGAVGIPLNVASAGVIAAGGGLALTGTTDLMMHAASDDGVTPARTDHEGSGGGDYEPTEGFRGSEYSTDEYVQFVNGHTGDADPSMPRPTEAEVEEALTKASPQKLEGQNAELFRYGDVKVILNYDMPWRSTAYRVDRG